MEPRLSLVTLGVADIARSRKFYEKMGWKASSASNAEVVFFQSVGMILALFGRIDLAADAGIRPEGSGFAGIALAHNVRARTKVDSVLTEAKNAGGTIVKAPKETPWGGYCGYFADPDGHLWEVAWNPHFPIDKDGAIHLPE